MNPDPNAKPQESKGTATRKSADGWPLLRDGCDRQNADARVEDGKMKDMQFKGHGGRGLRQREEKIR